MSEKGTKTLERTAGTAETDQRSGSRTRSAIARGATRVFSPRAFLVALVLAAAGMFLGGSIPLLSSIPLVGNLMGLVGVFVGTFVYGLFSPPRYVETAVAGGLVAGVSFLLNFLLLTVVGIGIPLVALAALGGGVAGVLGHYFGRDLRTGLTKQL